MLHSMKGSRSHFFLKIAFKIASWQNLKNDYQKFKNAFMRFKLMLMRQMVIQT